MQRVGILKRMQAQKRFVKEPARSMVQEDGVDVEVEAPLNMEFLGYNTHIMTEVFGFYGLRPKPTIKQLKKEAGFPNKSFA